MNVNLSGSYSRVEENNVGNKQQQVWSCDVRNQNFPYKYSCVTNSHNDIFYAPSDDAMNANRTQLLFRKSNATQNTQIQTPIYPAAKMVSGFRKVTPPTKHYAHITSCFPSVGGYKPVMSSKHKRAALTADQVTALEYVFQNQQYINLEERNELVQRLSVGDQVRLKNKMEFEEEQEAAQSLCCDMFAHTQSLLQHADENGYVQLTQQSIDELVNAIDAHLPKDLDLNVLIKSLETVTKEAEESSSSYGVTKEAEEHNSFSEVGASVELSSSLQEWWNVGVVDPVSHSSAY